MMATLAFNELKSFCFTLRTFFRIAANTYKDTVSVMRLENKCIAI